ncbi:MAG: metallophosphoesterase, partial [Planctomycetota bacterium]
MNGLFLSDLHLFSRRSTGQARWEASHSLVRAADVIVLGGDMFDLRWSQLGSLTQTFHAAEEWLLRAIDLNPSARWVFLPGNHDCHPELLERLAELSGRVENFELQPHHLQIGHHVFLHGDVLDARRHPLGLSGYRETFHEDQSKGRIANLMYSAVIFSRLHGVVPRIRHTMDQTCAVLLDYVAKDCQISRDAVQSICFGHTHVPINAHVYDGVTFRNPGSGIRHLSFAPVTFE